jgi:hypothetical protein
MGTSKRLWLCVRNETIKAADVQSPTIPGVGPPQPDKCRLLFLRRLVVRFVNHFLDDVDLVIILYRYLIYSSLQQNERIFCMVGPGSHLQAAAENSSNLQNY